MAKYGAKGRLFKSGKADFSRRLFDKSKYGATGRLFRRGPFLVDF